MIELIIAAAIALSTLTGTTAEVQTTDATAASTTTTTDGNPGGTGSWDDGN